MLRRLPDYTGPLLDFDLSAFGDWDSSEKVSRSRERESVCVEGNIKVIREVRGGE